MQFDKEARTCSVFDESAAGCRATRSGWFFVGDLGEGVERNGWVAVPGRVVLVAGAKA
jgi:hypothetical protein